MQEFIAFVCILGPRGPTVGRLFPVQNGSVAGEILVGWLGIIKWFSTGRHQAVSGAELFISIIINKGFSVKDTIRA